MVRPWPACAVNTATGIVRILCINICRVQMILSTPSVQTSLEELRGVQNHGLLLQDSTAATAEATTTAEPNSGSK